MQTATRELPIWRSLLFVPVNVPKFVATAHTRGSDAVILDLEDSVPPAEKATARTLIAAAAPKVAQSGADVVVRINQPIELAVRDIEAAISPAIHTLMLPKIDSAGHIRLLAELVDRIEAQKGMRVGHTKFMALIETPSAFARTDEIAAAHPRLISISLGSEDFAMEVGGEPATDVLFYPKQRVAIVAVANGLMPMGVIGSVADFMDLDGYRNSARLARRLGFRGASCIHPKHVDILNEERNLRAIRAERLNREILRTIETARKQFAEAPDAALGELKRALGAVVASHDIDPDVRDKLRTKVQAAIDQSLLARQKIDQNRLRNIEKTSAAAARDLAVDQLMQRDEQIEQLIDKVRAQLAEGFIGNADAFERAEEVARASFELAPYSGVTNAAIFDSEAAGQLDKAQRLRYLRYDKFLAQLYQTELAHVPFPDEPPILYPAPEVWKSLSERRQSHFERIEAK